MTRPRRAPAPRPRTVMFVTPYFPPKVGGVEAYVAGLARAVDVRCGWRSVVVTTDDGSAARVGSHDGIRVYRLPALMRVSYTPLDPRWLHQIRRIIRVERPDCINVHTPVPGLGDIAAWRSGDTPVIVTYHAASLLKAGHGAFNLLARAYTAVESILLRRADLVLGVSPHVAEILGRRAEGKVRVLENAVDSSAIVEGPRPAEDAVADVVFVARLDPTHAWKGLDLLLDAAQSFSASFGRQLTVDVIGDGADRERYEERARELGLGCSVRFLGSLAAQEKFAAVRGARTMVLCPTSGNDAFPTVLLEAWASGVAVVATAVGPLASLVEDRRTGLLVPGGSPDELAAAIHEVVTRPELHRQLVAGGTERVRTGYTWEQRAAEFLDLVEQVLA